MDNQEYIDWIAYDQIDPIPDPWTINAINCQTNANIHRTKSKPYELDLWLPVKPKKRQMSSAELKARFMAFVKPKKNNDTKPG